MPQGIANEVVEYKDELIEIRRKIHQNPELGFQEFETAKLIQDYLEKLNIPFESEIAKTGIVATIEGKEPGKTILLRADMDALPLEEDIELDFKSTNHGVMHACGHDTHVTCMLGAAKLFSQKKDQFKGTIKLVFQPAEEGSKLYDPSGKIPGGALPMIQERPDIFGTAEDPKIDGVLALHIVAGEDDADQIGKIGVKDGAFTGSADEFYITIQGKGGHGSAPHEAIDPVYIASQVNVVLQGYLSRTVDPMEPHVFTIGKIEGGFRQNIISETCRMEGTLRTLNAELREKLVETIPKVIKSTAQTFGGDAEVEIFRGYPVGTNDAEINRHLRKTAVELYGEDIIEEVEAQLGAEDFYEFGFKNTIPISMFWLGGGNQDKGWTANNHSNYFAIDEDALPMGTALLVGTAISFLNDEST